MSGRDSLTTSGSEGSCGSGGRKEPRVGGALARSWCFEAAEQLMEVVIEQAAAHSISNDNGRSEALELSAGERAGQMCCLSGSKLADMCMHAVDVCTACQHLGRQVLGRHSLSMSVHWCQPLPIGTECFVAGITSVSVRHELVLLRYDVFSSHIDV